MKKILSVLLFLILCVSAAGCGAAADAKEMPAPDAGSSYAAAKVSYLGPEGTYTQEACEEFFHKQGSYLPYRTVSDAVHALVSGESDYAVIPQENSIGGAVIDYVDTVIGQSEVSVAGEVELTINENLLTLPGTSSNDIRKVYSHQQGILEGKDWLEKNLPDAEVIEVSSTAEGAKIVSEGKDKSCAAIASAVSADLYGLEIFAENIQNNDKNKTRFYVLSVNEPAQASSDRLAFIAAGNAEDLPDLMTGMDEQGITLIAIHDRPRKTELGEYFYLIECSDCSYAQYEKLKEKSPFEFRFLGCFEVRR